MIFQRLFCWAGLVLFVPWASAGAERPVLDVDLSASRVRPEGRAQFIGAGDSRHLRFDVQSPASGADVSLVLGRPVLLAGKDRLVLEGRGEESTGLSTRDYAGVLDEVYDGYGIQKSSVSRHWKAASSAQLKELLERPLGKLDLCVLLLDGKEFHDFTLIVALGVDRQGRKHVLGLWSGATENAEVCGALLDDLIARGLSVDKPYLVILDGAKALKKAVVRRFGSKALVQRCRVHKHRNIRQYLPPKYHGMLTLKLRMAWGMTEYAKALQELRKVHDGLAAINQAAAASLEEGMEETLTVNRLGLPAPLRRLFSSTNRIESCFSRAGDLCRRVTRWRDGNMAQRWAGTVLLQAESRFRRIQAYGQLPLLINALTGVLDKQEAVA